VHPLPVPAIEELRPAQALDDHACHALVNLLQERSQARQVKPRAAVFCDAEGLPDHLAAEGGLLEVEEAGGALQIGQSGGLAARPALELAAGKQRRDAPNRIPRLAAAFRHFPAVPR
jgi:hypothetical protein